MASGNRIDALGSKRRLSGLSRPLLESDEDPALQRIVRAAARAVDAPIAIVSLVLDNIQFFRAQVGLPDDLVRSAATARDVSFCQFTVRDDALIEVEDAAERPDLPQTLVDSHGIRAYLGAPIHLQGQPLGSLCVIDTRPRSFTAAERTQLLALAREVDARIAAWSGRPHPSRPLSAAAAPLVTDMHDRIERLERARDELHITRTELAARGRMTPAERAAFGPIFEARGMRPTLSQLDGVLAALDGAVGGLAADLEQITGVFTRGSSTARPGLVIEQAASACRLTAEMIGGIVWATGDSSQDIARPAESAALLVAAVLAESTRETPRGYRDGLHVAVSESPGWVHFEIRGPRLADAALADAWRRIHSGPLDTIGVQCTAREGRLRLSLPAVAR